MVFVLHLSMLQFPCSCAHELCASARNTLEHVICDRNLHRFHFPFFCNCAGRFTCCSRWGYDTMVSCAEYDVCVCVLPRETGNGLSKHVESWRTTVVPHIKLVSQYCSCDGFVLDTWLFLVLPTYRSDSTRGGKSYRSREGVPSIQQSDRQVRPSVTRA